MYMILYSTASDEDVDGDVKYSVSQPLGTSSDALTFTFLN